MKGRVYVTLKKGVLDPQGKAIQQSLVSLGHSEVKEIRVGKFFDIFLEGVSPEKAIERLTEMGKNLLANQVIEDFEVKILD